jgi:hypothetical protein
VLYDESMLSRWKLEKNVLKSQVSGVGTTAVASDQLCHPASLSMLCLDFFAQIYLQWMRGLPTVLSAC